MASSSGPTWGDLKDPRAANSVCKHDERERLELCMNEAAELARAGAQALRVVFSAYGDQILYKSLPRQHQIRHLDTFRALFGRYDIEEADKVKNKLDHVLRILERIAPLSKDNWPVSITIFCNSTFYQDRDNQGHTWKEHRLADGTSLQAFDEKSTMEWKYNLCIHDWEPVGKNCNCSAKGDVAGYTKMLWSEQEQEKLEACATVADGCSMLNVAERDRITFCRKWLKGKDKNGVPAINPGPSITNMRAAGEIVMNASLDIFRRRAARLFLHEHLHTWTFNQSTEDEYKLDDSKSPRGCYGPKSAMDIARDDRNEARKNVDNVVYWCICMYFNEWNWSKGAAA